MRATLTCGDLIVGQRAFERRNIRSRVRNPRADAPDERGAANRLGKDRAAPGFEHATQLARHQRQIEMVQDRDAEYAVERSVVERQAVRRGCHEARRSRDAIGCRAGRREVEKRPGDIDARDARAFQRRQHRVAPRATTEFEHAETLDVAEEVILVLERIEGVAGRLAVPPHDRVVDPQRFACCQRRLDVAARNFRAFSRVQ